MEPRFVSPRMALLVGTASVALGLVAWVATRFGHPTALLPAIFGVLFIVLGRWGRPTHRQRRAAYGIGALALLGALGSSRGILGLIAWATGDAAVSAIATLSQIGFLVLSVALLVGVGRDLLANR